MFLLLSTTYGNLLLPYRGRRKASSIDRFIARSNKKTKAGLVALLEDEIPGESDIVVNWLTHRTCTDRSLVSGSFIVTTGPKVAGTEEVLSQVMREIKERYPSCSSFSIVGFQVL
jgi:hypothetical protein